MCEKYIYIIKIIYAHIYIKIIFILSAYYTKNNNYKKADILIRSTSVKFKNDSNHLYKNIKIVPSWPYFILYSYKKISFKRFISPLLFDIQVEPLRYYTWKSLFWECFDKGEYVYGLNLIDQYMKLIKDNKTIYSNKEFNYLLKEIQVYRKRFNRKMKNNSATDFKLSNNYKEPRKK